MDKEKSGPATRPEASSTCARCGAAFACGMQSGLEPCWCASLPPVLPLPTDGSGCYCPACLRATIFPNDPAA